MRSTVLRLGSLVLLLAACGDTATATSPPAAISATTLQEAPQTVTTQATTSPRATESVPASQPTTTTTLATTTWAAGDCSAGGMSGVPDRQPGLPEPVAAARNAIVAAAVRCDYDALAEMAAAEFVFAFDGGSDPAAYWREGEEFGRDPMLRLVLTLDLPSELETRVDSAVYFWPSAFAYDSWEQVPVEDRDALLALYSAEDLVFFEEFGGFLGERVGITAEGQWSVFVGGD